MSEQKIILYGYQREKAQVEEALQAKGSLRFVCLGGRGGMGKTTMLRAIQQEYFKEPGYCVTGLLDFDDWGLHILQNVLKSFADQLCTQDVPFREYFEETQRLHSLQNQDASRQLVQDQEERLTQAFLGNYQELSTRQRVILLLDTVEKVQHSPFFEELIQLLLQVQNSAIIFSGRESDDVVERLSKNAEHLKLAVNVRQVSLGGLQPVEALEYFQRSNLGHFIAVENPKEAALVCDLSGGRPIIIDLAIDWLGRGMNLPRIDPSLDEIDDKAREKLQEQFERGLVEQVGDLSHPLNEIILEMAHIYHYFNLERLTFIHPDYSGEQGQAWLNELRNFSFVKSQPGGGLRLHDEMERMVRAYVWPVLDPTGERRCWLSKRMIEYYQLQLGEEQEEEDPVRWQALTAEQLYHRLYADLRQGLVDFSPVFRQALSRQQLGFAQVLLNTLNLFKEKFDDVLREWANIHQGRLLRAQEKVEEAIQLIRPAKEKLQAMGVSHEMDMVCNALGYCYRLLGEWNRAIESYEEALTYSRSEHNARQIAESMNNIANVSRLGGDFERANRFSLISLLVRERLEDPAAIGHSCYVRGMVSWETANTAEAASYLERARQLFFKAKNEEGLADVDRYESFLYFRIGDPEEALSRVKRAIEIYEEKGIGLGQVESLNLQARIQISIMAAQGESEEAYSSVEDLARKALKIAERIRDRYKISECHLTLCQIYYRWGRFLKYKGQDPVKFLPFFSKALEEYAHPEGGEMARQLNYLALASVYEWYMADLHYEMREWQRSFEHYLKELSFSTHHKSARLFRALNGLSYRLHNLPSGDNGSRELTRQYCDFVIENWKKLGLAKDFPDIVEECEAIKTFLGLIDPNRLEYLRQWGKHLLQRGEWERATSVYQELLESHLAYLPGEEIAEAMNQSAWAYRQMGQFSQARRLCIQSMMIREKLGQPGPLASSHLVMGSIMWTTGNSLEAARELRLAETYYQKINDAVGIAQVKRLLAFLHFRINDFNQALSYVCQAIQTYRDKQCYAELADALNLQQRILLPLKRIDEAREANMECLDLAKQYGLVYTMAEALLTAGMVELEAANQEKSQEKAQEHLDLVKSMYEAGATIAEEHDYLLLSSVFEAMAGQMAFKESRYADAFEHYLKDLAFGMRYARSRMWRELDRIVKQLSGMQESLRQYYTDYIVTEWQDRDLAVEAPEVPGLMLLLKEYYEYV